MDVTDSDTLAGAFELFAAAADLYGSPYYAQLQRLMADDVRQQGPVWAFLRVRADDPLEGAYPMRLLGGVHRLVLGGEAPRLAEHVPTTGEDGDVRATFTELVPLLGSPCSSPPGVLVWSRFRHGREV